MLHPPGFPLQSWLDRLIVLLPHANPATAIAAMGLAAHACAAGLIAATLRRLGAGGTARILGAAAFALFPPVWAVSVEPELFALAHLGIAALVFLSVSLAVAKAPPVRAFVVLGLVASLTLATHPIGLLGVVMVLVLLFSPGTRRPPAASALAFAAALVIPALFLYMSLPLLRTQSVWPDWGVLRTPADVLRHVLRREYGTFSLSAASGEASVSGLSVFVQDAWRGWNVALALLAAGVVVLLGDAKRRPARPVLLVTLGLGLVLAAIAKLPEQTYSAAVLSRLEGPLVIAGAILIGLGFDALRRALKSPPGRGATGVARSADVAAGLAIVAALVSGWPEADVSRDRTLSLHAAGIALELPDQAVYATEGDVETFMGIETRTGTRFPISGPEITPDWYWRDVVPKLEPRVMQPGVVVDQWSDFLSACSARGLAIASTSPTLISLPDGTPELRGLIFVARSGSDSELTAASVAAAARLAPLAEALPRLPEHGHAFSRFYARRFARAYAGAAEALRREGDPLAACADSIADAINRDAPAAERSSLLRSFVARCTQR